jgi:hypothetical protein
MRQRECAKISERMTTTPKASQTHSRVGRPRLGEYRLECMLPRAVLDALIERENESGVYRTRIAANVLCEWAKSSATARINSQ